MPVDDPDRSSSSILRLVRGATAQIRLGLLRLTDSAPLIVAKEFGFFEDEGLEVTLSVEPSWANIADKVSYGLLDGAVMLPPLALAASLGLRGTSGPLLVPMALGLNGNTITFATGLADAVWPEECAGDAMEIGRRLRRALATLGGVPRFGIVHAFSSHNLLLRYWLAACGIDPERDLAFDVIPPARMVEALASERIIGFCAGAPWGEIARVAGLGRTVLASSAIWQSHPEKIFAVGRRFAEAQPLRLAALLRALLRAARHCDQPIHAEAIAALVAGQRYLDVEPAAVRSSLPGTTGGNESRFFRNGATFPFLSHARWFLAEMQRWGYLAQDVDLATAARTIYRPDLYVAAASDLGLPVPEESSKTEGAHNVAWALAARPVPIPMAPDCFCDGALFHPCSSGAAGSLLSIS